MSEEGDKIIIGRRDKADFPDLDLFDLDAKVDTGAYTSSIHCDHIEAFEKNGIAFVRFNLIHPSHPSYHGKQIEMPLHADKIIKNSFGVSERRFIIQTRIVIFGKEFLSEFSLADRSNMDCPVLLGRKLLRHGFIVDISRSNLSWKLKTRKDS